MTRTMLLVTAGLLLATVAGTIADEGQPSTRREIGGYQVLATDFHVHSFPFSWSTLSPFDTVLEARHQGLDAVALTPHNHVWVAQVGRWFSQTIRGPMVLVGEEITAPGYHILAVGIHDVVSNRQSAADAIDQIHRQGGVAIAAHPFRSYWPGYDDRAMRTLDGSEVVRPEVQLGQVSIDELAAFNARAATTMIGASDHHGLLPVGYARTYVFARARTESALLEAVREGHTVVFDHERAYGDPALIALVQSSGGLPHSPPAIPPAGGLALFSRVAALLALGAALLFNRW